MIVRMKDFLLDMAIAVVVLVIALPFAIKSCEPNEVVECDTIYIHDTIRIVEPQIVKEEVVRYEQVILPVIDTIVKIDTIDSVDSAKVVIPITERTYEDSTYKAVVRGYEPELVSLDLYNTTKYYPVVERVKVKPIVTLSAGVYGGIGQKGADYGLGIMVGVPIWSW